MLNGVQVSSQRIAKKSLSSVTRFTKRYYLHCKKHTLSYKNVTFNKIVVKKEAFQLPLIINLSVITNQQFHMSKAC